MSPYTSTPGSGGYPTPLHEQIAALNRGGLIAYADLLPLRQPFRPGVRWAPWGKTVWRFFRAWCAARVSGGAIPLAIWGGREMPLQLAACALCGTRAVDLRHILETRPGTSSYTARLPAPARTNVLHWTLAGSEDEAALKPRVLHLGLCVSALAAARAGR